jgi:hypothetical protein
MPEKVKELRAVFDSEAKKYNVLPLDNSTLLRWNTPRPSLTAGRTVFTYTGELTGVPPSASPNILNKSYTITAEVDIPAGGGEGMIVTEGGRFGGYGLFLSKGVAGIRRGKPVFLYNLLNLKRTIWSGPELSAGKHTIVFDFKSDGPELGKGGTGVLSVDGREVDRKSIEHTMPVTFPEDESFDVGQDTRTGVALLEYRYDPPFKFTGKINKLTFKLEPKATAVAAVEGRIGTDAPTGAGPDRRNETVASRRNSPHAVRICGSRAGMRATAGSTVSCCSRSRAHGGRDRTGAAGRAFDAGRTAARSTARHPAGVTVSRVAGAALLALGVACWLARDDAANRAAKGLIAAMLIYNAGVVAILVLARTGPGLFGIVFWPVGPGSYGAGHLVRRLPAIANPQRENDLSRITLSLFMPAPSSSFRWPGGPVDSSMRRGKTPRPSPFFSGPDMACNAAAPPLIHVVDDDPSFSARRSGACCAPATSRVALYESGRPAARQAVAHGARLHPARHPDGRARRAGNAGSPGAAGKRVAESSS